MYLAIVVVQSRIIFSWPSFFNSTCLYRTFNLMNVITFLFQQQTILTKGINTYMKLKIQTKQKLHFQIVQLWCAYTSNFCIISIIEKPEIQRKRIHNSIYIKRKKKVIFPHKINELWLENLRVINKFGCNHYTGNKKAMNIKGG